MIDLLFYMAFGFAMMILLEVSGLHVYGRVGITIFALLGGIFL